MILIRSIFIENDVDTTPKIPRSNVKSRFSECIDPAEISNILGKIPEEEKSTWDKTPTRVDSGNLLAARKQLISQKSDDFSSAIALTEELRTEESINEDSKDRSYGPLELSGTQSEPKKILLKSRGSSRNLLGKKNQEFKEDSLPDLSPKASKNSNGIVMIRATSTEEGNKSEGKNDMNKSGTEKSGGENNGDDKSKAQKSSNVVKKKAGKTLVRASTANYDTKALDSDNGLIASARRISEENEKKIREELDISSRQIEILGLIISFADAPRDLGGR